MLLFVCNIFSFLYIILCQKGFQNAIPYSSPCVFYRKKKRKKNTGVCVLPYLQLNGPKNTEKENAYHIHFNSFNRVILNILPIRCHVYMVLISHEGNLFGIQSCESKHANLFDNVTPITRCSCPVKGEICITATYVSHIQKTIQSRGRE